MKIVFLGPPGCGKGTQSEFFQKNGYSIISMGDILRKNKNRVVNKDTGETIGDIIFKGNLLPDFVTIDTLVEEFANLEDNKNNVIFDGFPRTVWQTGALEVIARPDIVFNFVIEDDLLVKRITGRFQCMKCGRIYNKYFANPLKERICDDCKGTEFKIRSDDNEEVLNRRLSEYYNKTLPITSFYADNGRLVNIDANVSMEKVREELLMFLTKKENR